MVPDTDFGTDARMEGWRDGVWWEICREVGAVGHNNGFGMERMAGWEEICSFLGSL